MSEITASVVHKVGGKEVIFRELSVADIRRLMSKELSTDPLGDALFDQIRLFDLPDFTSLTLDQVEALLPSQIKQVIKQCEAQNPDFFAMLARLHSRVATL